MRRTQDNEFDSLRVEGGLFPGEFLNDLRGQKLKGQANTDYGLHRTLKLRDEIGRFWRMARSDWESFQELMQREDLHRSRETVQRFLVPMLATVFGFDLSATRPIRIGEREFPISHLAFGGADAPHVPLLLTGPDFELDKSDPAFGEEGRRRSPQGLMQQYLNATDDALWGVICNGRYLRILRDNPSMTRPAFVEVDLTRLFEGELYADFVALWVLLHASRFAPQEESVECCWLEQWREQAAEQGERALKELRYGVEQALRELGNGFIGHPDNQFLREALSNGELTDQVFFQELLRLVYRFLFLLTAEDRNILHPPEADKGTRELYAGGYSLGLLRDRARKRRFYDQHGDLWQGLTVTFGALQQGETALGLPALGGLFAADQCPNLDRAVLSNKRLLAAVRAISWVQKKTGPTRINYRDMDTEELGSVYESLLELMPRINPAVRPWHFGFVGDDSEAANQGHARKTTGSYYTPDSLVQELIKSALVPVMEQRLEENANNPREALLSIKVCDPACGSGHFLLAAARKLAARLAELDAAGDQYTEQNFRHALREVVQHCIYGVDLNPLAVELCKTALWIEALEPGKPLGFLDTHIRCGNALVGVFDPSVLDDGIPDGAFKRLDFDDKEVVKNLKEQNKLFKNKLSIGLKIHAEDFIGLEDMPEESIEDISFKKKKWEEIKSEGGHVFLQNMCNLWLSPFFIDKKKNNEKVVPTNSHLNAYLDGFEDSKVMEGVELLSERFKFFNWLVEFPNVFRSGKRGFDVVLGNPPWDVMQFKFDEFFADRYPSAINFASAEREDFIRSLEVVDKNSFEKYWEERKKVEREYLYVKESGQYPLTSYGRPNLYGLFSELSEKLKNEKGYSGVIVESGIATASSTKKFFSYLVGNSKIKSFYDFSNKRKLFPSVDSRYKFCLMTMADFSEKMQLVQFCTDVSDIRKKEKTITISPLDIQILNPLTKTLPVFRAQYDADLTVKIYRSNPILNSEGRETFNIKRLFNIGLPEIKKKCVSEDSCDVVRMYESKMIRQYDNKFASYVNGDIEKLKGDKKISSRVGSRNFYPKKELEEKLSKYNWRFDWLFCWRDICRSDDERTFIATIIPREATDFTMRVGFPCLSAAGNEHFLLANMNSIVFDYIARQKIGGTHMSDYITGQLPIIELSRYCKEDDQYIRERVLELVYWNNDVKAFAVYLGFNGSPYQYDRDRRTKIMSDLDAYYAHLYGLTRDELRYILDPMDVMGEDYPSETFRGLKNKEMKEFGEYRTQRLVLEAYDQLARQRFAAEPEEPIIPRPLREVAAGEWASPPPESPEVRAMQILASVLHTWNERVSASQAQLSAVLVEKPRLVTAQLSGDQDQWLHAVGEEAELINQNDLRTLPRPDYAWGNAFREMVARGWLIEEQDTWRLGESVPPELFVEWALGRAGIVKALVENRGEELGDDLQDEIREVWSGVAA